MGNGNPIYKDVDCPGWIERISQLSLHSMAGFRSLLGRTCLVLAGCGRWFRWRFQVALGCRCSGVDAMTCSRESLHACVSRGSLCFPCAVLEVEIVIKQRGFGDEPLLAVLVHPAPAGHCARHPSQLVRKTLSTSHPNINTASCSIHVRNSTRGLTHISNLL